MSNDSQQQVISELLADTKVVNEIIASLVNDPAMISRLADDVSDEIEDLLEDDPAFRKQLIEAASSSAPFRKRIIDKVCEDILDD